MFQPCLRSIGSKLFSQFSPCNLVDLCLLRAGGCNLLISFCFVTLMGRGLCYFAQPQGTWWDSSASHNQASRQFLRHPHIALAAQSIWNQIHVWFFDDFYASAIHHSCTQCSRCFFPGFGTSSNCLTCKHIGSGLSHNYTFGCNQLCSKMRYFKGSPLWVDSDLL